MNEVHKPRMLRDRVARGRTSRALRACTGMLIAAPLITGRMRARLFRRILGFDVGNARILEAVRTTGAGGQLTIGDECFINADCLLELSDDITLSAKVHLAPRVSIYTSTHDIRMPPEDLVGPVRTAPVTIASDVWIGANAVLLPGVHIASGIVVAAGATVARSLQDPGVYAGVPAVKIRDLPSPVNAPT